MLNTGTNETLCFLVESPSAATGPQGASADANFRVRLTSNCSGALCGLRNFYLDWVPIRVYYGP